MARAAYLVLALVACRETAPVQPLYPAGTERDDGHGQLAHASTSLMTDDTQPARTTNRDPDRRARHDDYEAEEDGSAYGGPGYGGATYGSYRPPPWQYPTAPRASGFTPRAGLTGVIEGTISWKGATPKLTTSCGIVEPVRANKDRSLPGAVVVIERVSVGRPLVHVNGEQRPYTVGGTVLKRGCELVPRVQIVTPVPAAIAIHGDSKPARIRVINPAGGTTTQELQEGGRIVLEAKHGPTRIEGADRTLGAAWAMGGDAAYYALADDRGRYRIESLAPGTYELGFWYPPIPTLENGKLHYGQPVMVRRTVRVDGRRPTRLDVTLGP